MSLYGLIVDNIITQLWQNNDSVAPLAAGYTDITSQPGTIVQGAMWNGSTWVTPSPSPPDELPLWQLQAWLASQGLLTRANAIAAASPPPVPQWWSAGGALTIHRNTPGTIAFAAQLGLTTQAQIDAAFLAASAISLP